jgi:hypothetical protein
MKPDFLYRAMMQAFRFRGWSTFAKLAVLALSLVFLFGLICTLRLYACQCAANVPRIALATAIIAQRARIQPQGGF